MRRVCVLGFWIGFRCHSPVIILLSSLYAIEGFQLLLCTLLPPLLDQDLLFILVLDFGEKNFPRI